MFVHCGVQFYHSCCIFFFFRSCCESSLLLLIRLPHPFFRLMSGFWIVTLSLSAGVMNLSAVWARPLSVCGLVVSKKEVFICIIVDRIVSIFSSLSPDMFIRFLNSNHARVRLSLLLSLLLHSASTWVEPRNECSCRAFFFHLALRNCRGIVFTLHWCKAANEWRHR